MPNRPTLKTIGQLAGLSHVAVSKALRDAPDISAATKARVRKIADELGYTPNVAARNLYLKRTSTIGMVVPAMGNNTAYDLIFNEVSSTAAAQGFCVMLGSSHRSTQLEERHCRMMVENQVGAVIVAPCTSDISHIKTACGSTPVILIGGEVGPEEPCALLFDYRHSSVLAVEHLTALGHRDIALLTCHPANCAARQKEEGFVQAMEERDLLPRIVRAGNASNAIQAGMEGAELLISQGSLPTAVWCSSDYMAIGAIKTLRLHGLAVPGGVSVMGHDDLYSGRYPGTGLTTFQTPMEELGRTAAALAVDLIEDSGQVPPRQVFQPALMLRGSTAPPPAGAGAAVPARM